MYKTIVWRKKYAVWTMDACDGLVDIVFHFPRSKGHAAIDGKIDWDQNNDVGGCFLASREVAGKE